MSMLFWRVKAFKTKFLSKLLRKMVVKRLIITSPAVRVWANNLIFTFGIKIPSSREKFVRIRVDMYFDGELKKSFYPIVHCSNKETIFPVEYTINLKDIGSGSHAIKINVNGLGCLKETSCNKEFVFSFNAEKKKLAEKVKVAKGKEDKPVVTVLPSDARRFFNELRKRRLEEILSQRDK